MLEVIGYSLASHSPKVAEKRRLRSFNVNMAVEGR